MIQTSESSILYVGNNSTTVPYPVPFMFLNDEDLTVVYAYPDGEYKAILGTDYTVAGKGDPNGGSITTLWTVESHIRVSIVRTVPYTQLTSYEEGDSFPAKSHERALDKLTMEIQQVARGVSSGDQSRGANFRLTEASEPIKALFKINDTMVGIDAHGESILRTSEDMLGWLGQVGTYWQNDAQRANTRGSFPGQTGVQLDNLTIYIARSTSPGDWVPFLPGTGIVEANDGTPNMLPKPEGDLVGTTEPQILANKTLNNPTINNPSGLVPGDVGLENVDNTGDKFKPISDDAVAALALKQDLAERGVANGYPNLDGSGKVPLAQLPPESLGSNSYKGTWNASTNSPSITTGSAPGKQGWFYIVNVAGTTTVDGISSWAVGDYIVSNNTVWQKVGSSSAVTSVAGKTGSVTLVKADVGLSNVENYSASELAALPQTATNKIIDGANNTLNVRLNTSDVSGNLPTSRLNNGTGAAGNTWWCGDGSWKQPPGTGDVSGPIPATAADGDIAVFSGTTGKSIKTIGKSGAAVVTGPSSAVDGQVAIFSGTSVKVLRAAAPLTPVGSIIDYAGINEPAGWLFCDGRELLAADYPSLFTAIGQQYGTEDPAFFVREAHGKATTGSSLTVSAGLGGSGTTNRLLLVWAMAYVVGDVAITQVTFNGVPLTRHMEWALHTGMGIGEFSLYYMINPPEVTANVVMTLSKAATQLNLSAQLFARVNQTTPLGTAVASPLTATNSTAISVAVPSATNDLIVDALQFSATGTYTPTFPQDEFAVTDMTVNVLTGIRCSQRPSAGTTTTMGWTRPTSPLSMMGVAIKPLGLNVFKLPDLRGHVAAGRSNMGSGTPSALFNREMTGTVTVNSATISGLTNALGQNTLGLCRNMKVIGAGIPDGAIIQTIPSNTSITISVNATITGTSVPLRFGVVDGITLGSKGGTERWPLNTAEMPSHAHAQAWLGGAGGANFAGGPYAANHTSMSTLAAGGDDYHMNTQPTMILNKIIYSG
jgi:microcystin-dependent protein